MSNKNTDISQIKQYLKGELDARAMHELERRAQDDPFLMDALEGYEAGGITPAQSDAGLKQRLQQRVNRAERKIIPWTGVSIAASVLLVGSIGLWLYLAPQKQLQQQVAISYVTPAPKAITVPPAPFAVQSAAVPVNHKPAAALMRKPVIKSDNNTLAYNEPQDVASPEAISKGAPVADAEAIAQDTIKQYAAQGYFEPPKITILGGKKKIPTVKPGSPQLLANQQLTGKVEGANVDVTPGQQHEVTGQLLSSADGQPLANALVRIKGAPVAALTDRNGNFKLKAETGDVLVISSLGYQSREARAANVDSLKLALQPSQSALSEVVVTRAAAPVAQERKAMPLTGYEAYQKFLDGAVSSDGKKGTVQLQFTVAPDGHISNFITISSLSKEADQAAINRVKAGSRWRGGNSNKPEVVTVKIKFK